MKIGELLERKSRQVYTIPDSKKVSDAISEMALRKTSALVVLKDQKPAGIFTERDVFRCYMAQKGGVLTDMDVSDAMSHRIISAEPEDDLETALEKMIPADIRHLPVISKNRIMGMLLLNDLFQAQREYLKSEISFLHDYIHRLQDAGHD